MIYKFQTIQKVYQTINSNQKSICVFVHISNLNVIESNQIKIYQDKVAGIAHNKVMIIDNTTVITGSFNFTDNADKRNAENVILLHDSNVAKQYYDNWRKRNNKE